MLILTQDNICLWGVQSKNVTRMEGESSVRVFAGQIFSVKERD